MVLVGLILGIVGASLFGIGSGVAYCRTNNRNNNRNDTNENESEEYQYVKPIESKDKNKIERKTKRQNAIEQILKD